ncbi:MAG: stalk domain-containing protein [Bacillota bacterium]|nr:stalk domain-containing protein [Bacillota bacterium]
MRISRVKKGILVAAIIILFQISPFLIANGTGTGMWYYPPTPQGNVGVKKPAILWTFTGLSSDAIKGINMVLDGKDVKAVFREDINSVYYMPDMNLSEGKHNASIVVSLKNGVRISSPPFSFNIVKGALDEAPDTPVYEEVRDRINIYRSIAGLSPVTVNKNINAAAYNHAQYLTVNTNDGHYENDKSNKFFSGELPWDRAAYFGYFSPMTAENLHFVSSHIAAVDDWMDSVYHRFPIINPIFTDIGYGYAKKGERHINVLDVGAPKYSNLEQQIVVYPADGQRGVPLTWSGLEDPDPLRLYPEADGPGGYPITLMLSGDRVESVGLVKSSVTGPDGKNEQIYTFDFKNDPAMTDKLAIAIIPKKKLVPNAQYRVSITGEIKYNDAAAETFTKEWSFTTGNGVLELPGDNTELRIYVDGSRKYYEPKPFIRNGRVLVPVRSICEQLGAVVKWHDQTYTVEIIKEDSVITFNIGSRTTLVNNKTVDIDVPAQIYSDRTFVPLRFISEVLGYRVEWDNATRTVFVYGK